jgi:hypothetical protein
MSFDSFVFQILIYFIVWSLHYRWRHRWSPGFTSTLFDWSLYWSYYVKCTCPTDHASSTIGKLRAVYTWELFCSAVSVFDAAEFSLSFISISVLINLSLFPFCIWFRIFYSVLSYESKQIIWNCINCISNVIIRVRKVISKFYQ